MKTISGLVGGLIGGLIASLPWILLGVLLNFVWAFLAAPIAYGVGFGHTLLGGEKDGKYPYVIAITSVVVVVFVTLVIEPLASVYKIYQISPSIELLKLLYSDSGVRTDLLLNLVIAVAFTGLGISSAVRGANAEVKANKMFNDYQKQEVVDEENVITAETTEE